MTNINKELNEYLLNNKHEKQYKINVPSIELPDTSFRKWFRSNEDNSGDNFQLTRLQRLTGFTVCFLLSLFCFGISTLYVPVLLLKARKFTILYTLGSLSFLASFCFLWGPLKYLKSLFSTERRLFSILYISTLLGTLYFALHLQSTPLTLVCAVLQIITMLNFVISHIPGGSIGLKFFTRMFQSSINSTLPV